MCAASSKSQGDKLANWFADLRPKVEGMVPELAARAYSQRAAEYVELFGRIEQAAEEDREWVQAWASTLTGPIVDVGCGPGQWTSFLQQCGAEIEGVDPVAAFVASAQANYPESNYRIARAEQLGVTERSLGGILAWYSLIHTPPELLDACFEEFARSLKPGGSLLLGYFDGVAGEAFDHAVVTAYFWSADALSEKLAAQGFQLVAVSSRQDAGARPHGSLVANTAS